MKKKKKKKKKKKRLEIISTACFLSHGFTWTSLYVFSLHTAGNFLISRKKGLEQRKGVERSSFFVACHNTSMKSCYELQQMVTFVVPILEIFRVEEKINRCFSPKCPY